MPRETQSLDLGSIRSALAAGEPARALIELAYDRIESGQAAHPAVFIHLVPRAEALHALDSALARQQAGEHLPLLGASFAVKDNIDVAGMPTTAACPSYAYVPRESSPVVQRLLDAGAICVGKTNLDQFATGLVGVRSPYGACRNPFDARYVSGGSSSGSGVAVSTGWASFSLGTDTAGSGRVPAALCNVVGYKPTPGRWSTAGVVPACRSLDCVSLFTLTCGDASELRDVIEPHASARVPALQPGTPFRFGVPPQAKLDFFGDLHAERLFARAVEHLEALGGHRVELEWSAFEEAGELLYGGPFVAERYAAVGEFIAAHAESCLPITHAIIASAVHYSAADAFKALYRLEELRALAATQWERIDVMLLPTTPTVLTLAQIEAEPKRGNDVLGTYTRFANLLRCCAMAVPAGMRLDGLPFGVSLLAPEGCDSRLDALADALHRKTTETLGATGLALPLPIAPHTPSTPQLRTRDAAPAELAPAGLAPIELAVVGAHLSGLPLNHQLTELGATLACATRTAARYRLYALPDTAPPKPGLLRVGSDGLGIEVEVWRVPAERFGAFIAQVPPPLAIGHVELEDGRIVKGFVCEPYALAGARDISQHGGFRAYLGATAASAASVH